MDLGADYVATGHYCRRAVTQKDGKNYYRLLAGVDKNKDQSYFLCQQSQDQLSKSLFPIGELTKPEVRDIAKSLDLITADKKDSQGLCFIGKVKLPDFLQQKLKPKKGNIIKIDKYSVLYNKERTKKDSLESEYEYLSEKTVYFSRFGKVVGEHNGAHFFTKGQRKGLAVGGSKEPLYVLDTDVDENIIYVGEGKDHPGLYRNALLINTDEVHWIREDLALKIGETLEVMGRIRYRQKLEKAKILMSEKGLYVNFESPQSAISEGQFVAWYIGDELLGSGVIS